MALLVTVILAPTVVAWAKVGEITVGVFHTCFVVGLGGWRGHCYHHQQRTHHDPVVCDMRRKEYMQYSTVESDSGQQRAAPSR
jgi:hypothetical protein